MAIKKIPDDQIAFYQTPEGSVNIEVLYSEENIWLPQKRMAELFNTTVPNVNMHLKKIDIYLSLTNRYDYAPSLMKDTKMAQF